MEVDGGLLIHSFIPIFIGLIDRINILVHRHVNWP